MFYLLTLLTALQRGNRLLKLFSSCPGHPEPIAICYSPGTSFLRNINTTFPTGRKECSSPPKGSLLLSHPPSRLKSKTQLQLGQHRLSAEERSQQGAHFFRRHSPSGPKQLRTLKLTLDKSYITGVGISQEACELWPTHATHHPRHPRPCVHVLKVNASIYSGSLLKLWSAGGKGISYHKQR